MSGTAVAVTEELIEFYRLPVGRVERHEPNRRVDETDTILLTAAERTRAVLREIADRHRDGQPVLVRVGGVVRSKVLGLEQP